MQLPPFVDKHPIISLIGAVILFNSTMYTIRYLIRGPEPELGLKPELKSAGDVQAPGTESKAKP